MIASMVASVERAALQETDDQHDALTLAPVPCPSFDLPVVSDSIRADYATNGFAIVDHLLSQALCRDLIDRLEAMLAGAFDTGTPPDKVPLVVPRKHPRVEQFVNAWKGDRLFQHIVQSREIAEWVASVACWEGGAEVLQDQVWCKPPKSGPIAFHRDTAYMGEGVVTLWIALDYVDSALGPLEYAKGSHRWAPPPYEGYSRSLFGRKDWHEELIKAAAYSDESIHLAQVLVPQGGGSIHDGRTWHGSGVNTSKRARRGLGIHFGPRGALAAPPTALAKKIFTPKVACE